MGKTGEIVPRRAWKWVWSETGTPHEPTHRDPRWVERRTGGSETKTYRNPDIDKQVRPNEAIPLLRALLGNGLLRQPDRPVDEERLAEYQGSESSPRWNRLQHGPSQDAE